MNKTPRELAFLRDLYVAPEWTRRFTEQFDRHFKFDEEKEILYVNAGSGSHVLELSEKLGLDVHLIGYDEDEETNILARGKAEMAEMDVQFTAEYPREQYDLVIGDASLVEPEQLAEFVADAAALSTDRVAFFLPTAGSFGEIYSLLWEGMTSPAVDADPASVERLISSLPSVGDVESLAERIGLKRVKSYTAAETFDFENGPAFTASPLVSDFLMPRWLRDLDDSGRSAITAILEDLIAENYDDLAFRFTVKATLIIADKGLGDD